MLSLLQILENHYRVPLILLSSKLNKFTSFHLSLQVMFSKPLYHSFYSLCTCSSQSVIFLKMYYTKLSGWSLLLQGKSFLKPYQLHDILFGIVAYAARQSIPKIIYFFSYVFFGDTQAKS